MIPSGPRLRVWSLRTSEAAVVRSPSARYAPGEIGVYVNRDIGISAGFYFEESLECVARRGRDTAWNGTAFHSPSFAVASLRETSLQNARSRTVGSCALRRRGIGAESKSPIPPTSSESSAGQVSEKESKPVGAWRNRRSVAEWRAGPKTAVGQTGMAEICVGVPGQRRAREASPGQLSRLSERTGAGANPGARPRGLAQCNAGS
jgi:hypothetical protein